MDSSTASNSKQIVEKANERPEWLPDGWSVDFRTRKSGANMGAGYKCYIDPLNGYKFYSKPEVLRYLDAIKGNCGSSNKKAAVKKSAMDNLSPGSTKEVKIGKNSSIIKKDVVAVDKSMVDVVPAGQTKEVKIGENSNGIRKEPCYTDPVNEYPSKRDALHNFELGDVSTCLFKPNKRQSQDEDMSTVAVENSNADDLQPGSTKGVEMIMEDPVTIEKSVVDDLPPGWTKEVKIRKDRSGIRKDPYYIDPVSGYAFFSKKDALRYIESGDITKCRMKPQKRQVQDEDNSTLSSTAKRQKLKQPATKRQLFVGKKISEKNSIEFCDTKCSEEGHNLKVDNAETVVKMHSPEDAASNTPEMNKISDPAHVQEKNYVLSVMKNAEEKNHSSPSISNKKGLNVPHRFSRRLAGVGPDQVSDPDNMINEQTLLVPKRSLRKSRTTLDVGSVNVLSQQLNFVPKVEHVHKIPGELLNKSNKISEGKGDFSEQPHHNSLCNDYNSPSLKGATKTTGEIGKVGAEENKSSNKKVHNIPHRASKRLAGFEPDITNSMLNDKPPEYKGKKSKAEVNAESCQIEGIPPKTCEQQDKLGDGQLDDEKPEPQLSFAFHYSWSDPSVEFAINTLMGALPVEDSTDKGPALVPETDVVEKTRLSQSVIEGKGPVLAPETDVVDKTKLSESVTEEGKEPVLVPETVVVDKTKLSKSVTEGEGPVLIPETDVVDKTKLSNSVTEGSNGKNRQVTSKKSKYKKEPSLPRRLSKRLAGHEPEVAPADRALEYATKKSCKDEPTPAATSGNAASKHLNVVEETEIDLQAPISPKIRVHGESSNKSEKSDEVQIVPNEQLQKIEAENVNESSEPELSLPFGDSWSDPCLEFAIKTLTGALPVDSAAENFPVMTPDLNSPPNTGLLESVVEKCIKEEAHVNLNQSQNIEVFNKGCQLSKQLLGQPELLISSPSCENAPKSVAIELYGDNANINRNLDKGELLHSEDIEMVCQPSRHLLGQPELRTSSTSCENTPKFIARECHGDEANITKNSDERVSLNIEAGNEYQLAHQFRNIDTSILQGPSNNIRKVFEKESAPAEPPQLETQTQNQGKSESQFSAPLMDSWSDPCLEFAFKTLTGAISVEENLSIQGCFQEPANNFCSQRDTSPMLPDFQSPSFSQGGISFHYNVEKSMPGQQLSMSSSSILPPEKVTPHCFAGFDSQKHYSQSSRNSQGS